MNIKLPGFVLADIYRNNIVTIPEDTILISGKENNSPLTLNPEYEKKWFLGDNKKRILIIVADKNAAIISDESLSFLSKILTAFNCSLADVAIINHSSDAKKFSFLNETFHPQKLLLFGPATQEIQLPFTIPYYQVQPYNNCRFLSAPDLITLNNDSPEGRLEKSKLWLSLKKVFEE